MSYVRVPGYSYVLLGSMATPTSYDSHCEQGGNVKSKLTGDWNTALKFYQDCTNPTCKYIRKSRSDGGWDEMGYRDCPGSPKAAGPAVGNGFKLSDIPIWVPLVGIVSLGLFVLLMPKRKKAAVAPVG